MSFIEMPLDLGHVTMGRLAESREELGRTDDIQDVTLVGAVNPSPNPIEYGDIGSDLTNNTLTPGNIAQLWRSRLKFDPKAADEGLYYVVGDHTMHGITKEVELEAEYHGIATSPFTGTPTIGLDLEGKVNRKDFGMVWNKTLDAGGVVLGNEIKIVVHIEATVPPEKS